MNCWICGEDATSGEHLLKAASLREVFGAVRQAQPIFYNSKHKRNKRLQSIDSKYLKSKSLCVVCNSTRTQAADRAFDAFMVHVMKLSAEQLANSSVRLNHLFRYRSREQAVQLHLYFVKLFGCMVCEGNIPISLEGLSDAISGGKPHPGVFVAIGPMAPTLGGDAHSAGLSDFRCDFYANGQPAFAAWFMHFGAARIQVMLAAGGEHREGLTDAWHPNRAKRICFREFPSE